MNDDELVGVCGLYCGACPHYRASFPEGKHILEQAAKDERTLEGFTCLGCRADTLYVHPGCSQCEFRACAEERDVLHCGLCPDYPCGKLEDFQGDGRPHHGDIFDNIRELNEVGAEEWLVRLEERWRCGGGAAFSWYELKCESCGEKLDSYGPDPKRKR